MTINEAACILGLSAVRVRQLCLAGRLGSKRGRDWWITPAELAAFRAIPRPPGRPRQTLPCVLISRCLLGVPCRYHGLTHRRGRRIGRPALVARLRKRYQLIDVCPECDAGMPVPRPPTRIVGSRWICDGEDVTADFLLGADKAWEQAQLHKCRKAYLLKGSPACDSKFGSAGLCLARHGIRVHPV